MAEFVSLATWLREPEPAVIDESLAVIDEPVEEHAKEPTPQDALIDDVCARVRRFRAMLADTFDYVKERGAPTTPLIIRVHPSQMATAAIIGLPLVDDTQLRLEEAVIELRCGSIDARLLVPLERLLVTRDR